VTNQVQYPQVGVCGLSCRLCPRFHTDAQSKCDGCKTASRMGAGCPFITCAVKKKGIEFCWQCEDCASCEKWQQHRELGKQYDSFICYRALEANIDFIHRHGIEQFEKYQKKKEQLLTAMLREFDDGRSKSYYCIAATVLTGEELQLALETAHRQTASADKKERAYCLHTILDNMSARIGVPFKLRKSR
jgi:hypothetical protein